MPAVSRTTQVRRRGRYTPVGRTRTPTDGCRHLSAGRGAPTANFNVFVDRGRRPVIDFPPFRLSLSGAKRCVTSFCVARPSRRHRSATVSALNGVSTTIRRRSRGSRPFYYTTESNQNPPRHRPDSCPVRVFRSVCSRLSRRRLPVVPISPASSEFRGRRLFICITLRKYLPTCSIFVTAPSRASFIAAADDDNWQ